MLLGMQSYPTLERGLLIPPNGRSINPTHPPPSDVSSL